MLKIEHIVKEPVERMAVITLRPTATHAQARKKVVWTEDTVDNEHMNKKKSKCCCIYEKPRKFGESDSESSDDECEHCYGHVEKKRATHGEQALTINDTHVQEPLVHEPTAIIALQPPEPAPAPSDPAPAPPDKSPPTS